MKLALIGCGRRMSNLVAEIARHDPELRIVGLLDPDEAAVARLPESSRADVRRVADVAELLRTGADAVAVGTRCNLHAPYATALADSGLPLFLEKPVAVTLDQAEVLERAFRGRRTPVVVSFPLRMTPLFAKAKSLVQSAAFGRPEHILATNYVPYGDVYFTSWYRDHAVTQGLFLQKATHDLDYLMDLVGVPVVRVAAMASHGRVYRDRATQSAGAADAYYLEQIGTPAGGMNEDSSSVLLEFADGTKAVYTQVFFSRGRAEARGATISSYAGTLSWDWYRGSVTTHWHHAPFSDVSTISSAVGHWGGDEALTRHFVAVVQDGVASAVPLSAGLRSAFTCLAAKVSAERGVFMPVHQVAEDVL